MRNYQLTLIQTIVITLIAIDTKKSSGHLQVSIILALLILSSILALGSEMVHFG